MFSWHNIHFKQPSAAQAHPERSPSPPHSYVEPLSPSNYRPRPIEPSFNYPALGFKDASRATHTADWRQENGDRRGHFRKPSSMDALADAALAMNQPTRYPAWEDSRPYTAVAYAGYPDRQEPSHKRARTETYPAGLPNMINSVPQSQYDQRYHEAEQERRLEAANMLINFSSVDARVQPQLPTHTHTWQSVSAHPAQTTYNGYTYVAEAPAIAYQHNASFHHYQSQMQRMPAYPAHDAAYSAPSMQPAEHGDLPKKARKRTQKSKLAYAADANMLEMPSQLISPQRGHSNIPTPETMSEHSDEHGHAVKRRKTQAPFQAIQQVQTPPDELDQAQQLEAKVSEQHSLPPKRRGWPKGKPRGPNVAKPAAPSKRAPRKKKGPAKTAEQERVRSRSLSLPRDSFELEGRRAQSVPRGLQMIIRKVALSRNKRKLAKDHTICAGCQVERKTATGLELDEWISCNGCKQWFHQDCAGFKNAVEVREVDKFFCSGCEGKHGKTTYVRKSRRAHTSVDYAELQKGVLKTSDESNEHHYIQPIKDGSFVFDPETFPRVRPEMLTKEYFESGGFTEPVCIPAAWNRRPWGLDEVATKPESDEVKARAADGQEELDGESYEYESVLDEGQDALGMIMPKSLTVRKVCNLVGPYTPLDVIDVKTQNSGAKWNLARWADYYESTSEDKPVRNVISLEVSHTKLGRLLRRPQVVRDIDLQDQVWPQEEIEKGKWPKVQYYCLMSIADSYTDFHIDFGGSSVYYHLIKGKKTFFFIPPKTKHLKAYEEWNNNPQQNFTFLPDITKECYRVDLHEGDTMLIPSGWIHAVWTPETSLVIGGNFLTRMSFKNQFKVAEIEKNNETPQKFRYPYFQRLMWWTAIEYMEKDPLPESVEKLFLDGRQFQRDIPIWREIDGEADDRPGMYNARYYSQAEVDGLPDLVDFIFRTVLISQGCMDGITPERVKRVASGIPVSRRHGGALQLAKAFAQWVAWKRGNENPPNWAHPSATLPAPTTDPAAKKLSARAVKDLERREANSAAAKSRNDRQTKRASKLQPAAASSPVVDDSMMYDAIHVNHTQQHTEPPVLYEQEAVSWLPPAQQALQQENNAQAIDRFSPEYTAQIPVNGSSQHVSTPKTSVLGPRRVACDPCRRRRIKCKHKDVVVQASPDLASQVQQQGEQSSPPSMQLDGAYDAAAQEMSFQSRRPSYDMDYAQGSAIYYHAEQPVTANDRPVYVGPQPTHG